MASAPAPPSNLNPYAIPFTPFPLPHNSQIIPHHFPLHYNPQFPHPLPFKNPNFIIFPDEHRPFPYPREEVDMHQLVRMPELNGGFRRNHRNRGFRRRNCASRNGIDQASRRQNHRREPNSRAGNANSRRNFTNSSRWDIIHNRNPTKEAEESIPIKSDGEETSVMIRNIPNRYTRKLVEKFLTKHCYSQNAPKGKEELKSAFDFLYLPIDFKTKWNKGYAFVNFTTPIAARGFLHAENERRWELFNSSKIRDICCAKIQGKEKLIRRFQVMEFPSEEFQPLCYVPARDGSHRQVKKIPIGFCIKPNKP